MMHILQDGVHTERLSGISPTTDTTCHLAWNCSLFAEERQDELCGTKYGVSAAN